MFEEFIVLARLIEQWICQLPRMGDGKPTDPSGLSVTRFVDNGTIALLLQSIHTILGKTRGWITSLEKSHRDGRAAM
jgi:hypothetical protein